LAYVEFGFINHAIYQSCFLFIFKQRIYLWITTVIGHVGKLWPVINPRSVLPKLIRVHPAGKLPEKRVITGISWRYALTV
jgi:hypothetical protein